jgi:hypothetical protein
LEHASICWDPIYSSAGVPLHLADAASALNIHDASKAGYQDSRRTLPMRCGTVDMDGALVTRIVDNIEEIVVVTLGRNWIVSHVVETDSVVVLELCSGQIVSSCLLLEIVLWETRKNQQSKTTSGPKFQIAKRENSNATMLTYCWLMLSIRVIKTGLR